MEHTINDLLFDFMEKIDEIYGVYLDAEAGFIQNNNLLEKAQRLSNERSALSVSYLDTLPYLYSKGTPTNPNTIVLHEVTQGRFKERNKEGGANHVIIAHLCLTQIYQYWEDHYKSLIANAIGISKEDLKSDIFGDIRIYRNSIIHYRGVALPNIKKCKILKWFNEGDSIVLTSDQIEEIIFNVKNAINSIPEKYCG
ncbi:MAG: hypothetical protein QM687_07525 [Ferruginibacter sp.]